MNFIDFDLRLVDYNFDLVSMDISEKFNDNYFNIFYFNVILNNGNKIRLMKYDRINEDLEIYNFVSENQFKSLVNLIINEEKSIIPYSIIKNILSKYIDKSLYDNKEKYNILLQYLDEKQDYEEIPAELFDDYGVNKAVSFFIGNRKIYSNFGHCEDCISDNFVKKYK